MDGPDWTGQLWLSAMGASTCIFVWAVSVLVRKRVDGVGVFYILWSSGRFFSSLISFPVFLLLLVTILCLFFSFLIHISHARVCLKPFLYYWGFFLNWVSILGPNGAYSIHCFSTSCLLFPRFRFHFTFLLV